MTKTRKLEAGLVIAGFAVLWVILLLSLVSPADTRALNRLPAERPGLELTGVFEESYRSAWTAWLTDKLMLAGPARRANAAIENEIFRDAGSRLVVRGEEGWLYLRASIDLLLPGQGNSREEAAVEGIRSALTVLRDEGFQARLAFAPNKVTIYPEHLPDGLAGLSALASAHRSGVLAELEAELAPAGLISVFAAMEERGQAAPHLLYNPRDTHWNSHGAAVMAEAFVRSLAPDLWTSGSLRAGSEVRRVPDLVQLQGGSDEVAMVRAAIERPGISVTFETGSPEDGFSWRTQARGPGERHGVLVLIGDSFAFELHRLLAPYFDEVRFVPIGELEAHGDGGAFEGAQIVFVQIVERHLLRGAPHGPERLGRRLANALQP